MLLLAAPARRPVRPGLAVDVPDQLLIDLERLAVTAWSARDRPPGRRGRAVVPVAAVAAVAARGTRIVTAASVAILVVAGVSAPLLLADGHPAGGPDRGALPGLLRGGGLLLAARSYRHAARAGAAAGGRAGCWARAGGRGPARAPRTTADRRGAGARDPARGLLLVVVAVATGRGWRSAWWARRAEVAEALCGSAAVASLLVADGRLPQPVGIDHLDV